MHFGDTLLSGNTCFIQLVVVQVSGVLFKLHRTMWGLVLEPMGPGKHLEPKKFYGLAALSHHSLMVSQILSTSLSPLPFLLTGCFGLSIVCDFTHIQCRLAGDSVHHHSGIQADGDSSLVCFFDNCGRGKEAWRTVQGHLKHLPRTDMYYWCSHFTDQSKAHGHNQLQSGPGRAILPISRKRTEISVNSPCDFFIIMFACSLKLLINED